MRGEVCFIKAMAMEDSSSDDFLEALRRAAEPLERDSLELGARAQGLPPVYEFRPGFICQPIYTFLYCTLDNMQINSLKRGSRSLIPPLSLTRPNATACH
jgi:hypothetical protein